MRTLLTPLALCAFAWTALPAAAADRAAAEQAGEPSGAAADASAAAEPETAEEIIVISDGFARWDNTRWHVQTQIVFPTFYLVQAFRNTEFEAPEIQVEFVLTCNKSFRRAKKRFEVDCQIEDIAFAMTTLRPNRKVSDVGPVLDEWDATLTGAAAQLLVADDGRVIGVGLEQVRADDKAEELAAVAKEAGDAARDADTVRGQAVRESMRGLLRLSMAAFHMRLPQGNVLREGQWVEYQPTLFEIPTGDQNTMSGGYLIHQLDRYKGHNVVQSKGEGTVRVGWADDDADENYFKMKFDGVAIYDDSGIMTERVWALKGRATGSGTLGELGNVGYFHSGRIRQLKQEAVVLLRDTAIVGRPNQPATEDRPAWVPIE